MKRYFKVIKKSITSAGQIVSISESTLEHAEKVVGVFTGFSDNQLKKGATLELKIDNNEIIPDGFEASLLASKDGVSINQVALKVDEKAGGTEVRGKYIDATPVGEFVPYDFRLYLVCEDLDK